MWICKTVVLLVKECTYLVEDIFSELYETKLVLDLDSFPFAPKIVAEMIATMTSTEV
jgi:hypothetical protein